MKNLDIDGYLERQQMKHDEENSRYELALDHIADHWMDDIESLVKQIESEYLDIIQYFDRERGLDVQDDVKEMIMDLVSEYL